MIRMSGLGLDVCETCLPLSSTYLDHKPTRRVLSILDLLRVSSSLSTFRVSIPWGGERGSEGEFRSEGVGV